MGLLILIAGIAVFAGVHVFVTQRAARARLIAKIGEPAYKISFSLLSVLGVALIAFGFARYRGTGWVDVWYPPRWTHYIAVVLMWLAFVSVAAASIPGRLKERLKHPLLVGVKLWALAHLITNGDLGSILLFGGILAWAVFDRISLKTRAEAGNPPIIASARSNDAVAVLIGTIIFLAFGYVFHPLWIGVPVFGTPALGT